MIKKNILQEVSCNICRLQPIKYSKFMEFKYKKWPKPSSLSHFLLVLFPVHFLRRPNTPRDFSPFLPGHRLLRRQLIHLNLHR